MRNVNNTLPTHYYHVEPGMGSEIHII